MPTAGRETGPGAALSEALATFLACIQGTPGRYRCLGRGQRAVPRSATAGAQPGVERHERPAEAGLGESDPKLWIKSTPSKAAREVEAHILPSPRKSPKGPSVQAWPTSWGSGGVTEVWEDRATPPLPQVIHTRSGLFPSRDEAGKLILLPFPETRLPVTSP